MLKKESKQAKGRKRLLPLLFVGLLLCLTGKILLKSDTSPAKTPKTPAEVFTHELEEALAEQAPEVTTLGAAAETIIIDRVQYTILEQSDTQVMLGITAPDLVTILNEANQKGETAEDILETLQAAELPTKNTVLTVELDEDGNVIESRAFVDAMYGGLLTYLEQFVLETEGLE